MPDNPAITFYKITIILMVAGGMFEFIKNFRYHHLNDFETTCWITSMVFVIMAAISHQWIRIETLTLLFGYLSAIASIVMMICIYARKTPEEANFNKVYILAGTYLAWACGGMLILYFIFQ